MQSYVFQFGYPWILYSSIIAVIIMFIVKHKWPRFVKYSYSLADVLDHYGETKKETHSFVLNMVRALALILIGFIGARPQLIDVHSQITVEGIDIILLLDVSGSMQFRDYKDDPRSRLEVAKNEAIRFVDKRKNDAIGLVLFGNDALSRCPLTNDKTILHSFITDIDIGIINPDGTLLSRGLLTAINRLKKSKSKSKIIILLTDGEPSEGDVDPKIPLEAARQLGIKVYTIGIGSDEDSYFVHPLYGAIAKPKINKNLLHMIADQTGGRFFLAHSSKDMRDVYDTIDQLEKVEYETPLFSKTEEIYPPFAIAALFLLCVIMLILTFVWYGL
jgi:Ca-activated chloride channel family protein